MELVEIFKVDNGVLYAGFFKRVIAVLIDILIISILSIIIFKLLGNLSFTYIADMEEYRSNIMNLVIVKLGIFILLYYFYNLFLESSKWQATIGKKLLGIIVTDLDGDIISFDCAMYRAGIKIISIYTLGIGFLMVFMTNKKQALHDKILRTLVLIKQ